MSTDITIIGNVRDIKIGLTPIIKRLFVNTNKEKNTNDKLNNKKANCQSLIKKTLHNAIKKTGSEKKSRWGLIEVLSIKKKSKKLNFNLIKSSAHLENLIESEDIECPDLK